LDIWATLTLASHISLQKLQAFGDSRVIIDWLNDRGQLKVCSIEGWKTCIKSLSKNFQVISFHHIYRDFNKEEDKLSKVSLLVPKGKITYYWWDPGGVGPMNHLDIF